MRYFLILLSTFFLVLVSCQNKDKCDCETKNLKPTTQLNGNVSLVGDTINSEITILALDSFSMSPDFLGPTPWKRTVFGKMLEYFTETNSIKPPSTIGIDLFFDLYRNDHNFHTPSEEDKAFFSAVKMHDNLIFGILPESPDQRWSQDITSKRLKYILPHALKALNPEVYTETRIKNGYYPLIEDIKPPVTEILATGAYTGVSSVERNKDNAFVTHMPLVVLYQDERLMHDSVFLPSTTLSIIARHYQVKTSDIIIKFGSHISLKNAKKPIMDCPPDKGCIIKGYEKRNISIPINKEGKMRINYQGPSGSFDTKPFATSVFDEAKDNLAMFSNRLLLVGFTSHGSTSSFATPCGSMVGIELIANALYTILNEKYLP